MIHIRLISLDTCYAEASCLWDIFQEVKRFAACGQRLEDQEEGVMLVIGYCGPNRREGNILRVDKLAPGIGRMVHKVGGFPYADHHTLPTVVKIAVYIDMGVAQQLGL